MNEMEPDAHHKDVRVIWVKKNLKDPTAAFSYSLSVSILHLAMICGLCFVKHPDLTVIQNMNSQCKKEAEDIEYILHLFLVAHCMSFFATAFREMYHAKTDLFGQLMRMFEVVCIPVLIYAILSTIELVTLSFVRMYSESDVANSDPPLTSNFEIDKSNYSQI